LDFASGVRRICNQTVDFVDPQWGHTWTGYSGLVSMSDIAGGPQNLAPLRQYRLSAPYEFLTASERLDLQLGLMPALVSDRPEYAERSARLWGQIVSDDTLDELGRPAAIGIPFALHSGTMDRAVASFGPNEASVTLSVESIFARKGNPVYGRLTPRDQQLRFTGDNGLRFVPEVMNTSPVWTTW
jgi:hypothetical protein